MNAQNVKLLLFYALIISVTACKNETNQHKENYVIELIGSDLDVEKVKSIALENNVADTQLYQWKNHVVIYSQIPQPKNFEQTLKNTFPKLTVKIYENPFYNFTKTERCENTATANEWKHILLTANLVEDKTMQQEYLGYHAIQFEAWPEVAKGFCNADFQQLLVYLNGRQLMLVISIPADKTLGELDPKTVENNPRMDEWNALMGEYQEGIEGTKPEEKWVFLK